MHRSPHGREIMDEKHRRVGAEGAEAQARFEAFLTRAFAKGARDGVFDLKRVGLTPEKAMALLQACLEGVVASPQSDDDARAALTTAATVFLDGVSA